MGFFSDLFFGAPKPAPVVIIKDVLGREIDRVEGVRDLWGKADWRGRQWAHADLRGQYFDDANCEDLNLFGADLRNCSFARCNLKNANLAYAHIEGARFNNADLDGVDLLYTDVKRASFDGCMVGPTSTIPGIYAGIRRKW